MAFLAPLWGILGGLWVLEAIKLSRKLFWSNGGEYGVGDMGPEFSDTKMAIILPSCGMPGVWTSKSDVKMDKTLAGKVSEKAEVKCAEIWEFSDFLHVFINAF